MKENSYGVFTIDVLDENDNVKATVKAFNDLTEHGLRRLANIINDDMFSREKGSTNPFSKYIKLGSGTANNNNGLTDLENPTYGYYNPYPHTTFSGNSALSVQYDRVSLDVGVYGEIGLFDTDEDGNPTNMLCRARFRNSYGTADNSITVRQGDKFIIGYSISVSEMAAHGYRVELNGQIHDVKTSYGEGETPPGRRVNNVLPNYAYPYNFTPEAFDDYPFKRFSATANRWLNSESGIPAEMTVTTFSEDNLQQFYTVKVKNPYTEDIFIKTVDVNLQGIINKGYSTTPITHTFTPAIKLPVGKQIKLTFSRSLNVSPMVRSPISFPMNRDMVNYSDSLPVGYQSVSYGWTEFSGWDVRYINLYSNGAHIATADVFYTTNSQDQPVYRYAWKFKNTTEFTGNNIIKAVLFSHDKIPSQPYYYSPWIDTGAYPRPESVSLTSFAPVIVTVVAPTGATHLRVITDLEGNTWTDLPVTIDNQYQIDLADVHKQNGFMFLKWVGPNGTSIYYKLNLFDGGIEGNVKYPLNGFYKLPTKNGGYSITAISPFYRSEYDYGFNGEITNQGKISYEWLNVDDGRVMTVRYRELGPDGWSSSEVTKFLDEVAVEIPFVKKSDWIPYEDIETNPEFVEAKPYALPIPIDMTVNEVTREITVVFPADGRLLFYSIGSDEPQHFIDGDKLEKVTFNYRDLFEVSAGVPLKCVFTDMVNESLPIYHYSNTLGRPADLELTYDPVNKRLYGPIGYNTSTISIRRWLTPHEDIPLVLNQTYLDVILDRDLDPAGRYEVYAVSSTGKPSKIPFVIQSENEDILPPPITDLSKPEGYNQATLSGGAYPPLPNFAQYNPELFAGEINDEPITFKSVEEYVPGRWKCMVKTLNWEVKWQLYDPEYHNSYDDIASSQGYDSLFADPKTTENTRITIWTSWVKYDFKGFNAFLNDGNIGTPFTSSSNSIGTTLTQQLGYYKVVYDVRRSTYQSSNAGFIFDHSLQYNASDNNRRLTPGVDLKITPGANVSEMDIYIDDVKATITPILEEDVIVKYQISTPDYTFEQDYINASVWKLVSNTNRIDDPTYVNQIISIRLGSTKVVPYYSSDYYYPYYRNSYNQDMVTRNISTARYGSNAFVFIDRGRVTWTYYLKPYLTIAKPPYTPPTWPSNTTGDIKIQWYNSNPSISAISWYIDGVEVSINDLAENSTGGYTGIISDGVNSYLVKEVILPSDNWNSYIAITIINSDGNLHTISHDENNTSYRTGTQSCSTDEFLQNSCFRTYYIRVGYSSTLPTEFQFLSDLDLSEDLSVRSFIRVNGNLSDYVSSDDLQVTINGNVLEYIGEKEIATEHIEESTPENPEPEPWYSYEDHQIFSTATDLESITNEDTVLVITNDYLYLEQIDGSDEVFDVQVKTNRFFEFYGNSFNNPFRMISLDNTDVSSNWSVDPTYSARINAQIAFKLKVLDPDVLKENTSFEQADYSIRPLDKSYSKDYLPVPSFSKMLDRSFIDYKDDFDNLPPDLLALDELMQELRANGYGQFDRYDELTICANDIYTQSLEVDVNGTLVDFNVILKHGLQDLGDGDVNHDVEVTYHFDYNGDTYFCKHGMENNLIPTVWLKANDSDFIIEDASEVDTELQITYRVLRPAKENGDWKNKSVFYDVYNQPQIENELNINQLTTIESADYKFYTDGWWSVESLTNWFGVSTPVEEEVDENDYIPTVPPSNDSGFMTLDGIYELWIDGVLVVGGATDDIVLQKLLDNPDLEITIDEDTFVPNVAYGPSTTTLSLDGVFDVLINGTSVGTDLTDENVLDLLNNTPDIEITEIPPAPPED